jgi:hypothetical protein
VGGRHSEGQSTELHSITQQVLGGEAQLVAGMGGDVCDGAQDSVELHFHGHVPADEALYAVRGRQGAPGYVGDLSVVHTQLRPDLSKKLSCRSCKRRCDHVKNLENHLSISRRRERSKTHETWVDAAGNLKTNCVSKGQAPVDIWSEEEKKGHWLMRDRVNAFVKTSHDADREEELKDWIQSGSDHEDSEFEEGSDFEPVPLSPPPPPPPPPQLPQQTPPSPPTRSHLSCLHVL